MRRALSPTMSGEKLSIPVRALTTDDSDVSRGTAANAPRLLPLHPTS